MAVAARGQSLAQVMALGLVADGGEQGRADDRVVADRVAEHGAPAVEEAEDFHAAVLQHEIDQLDGIFWIDRLSRLKRERLLKRYQKLGGRSAILPP